MNSPNSGPILVVTQLVRGLLIQSQIPNADGNDENFRINIMPGESFGGHSYAEWEMIAKDSGRIDASWLEV